jgi:predicted aspartyl protease
VLPRIAAIALLTVLIASAASDAQPPKISKPRPVPADRPMIVQPLPPASFDNQLQIGGDDLKARERSTRLTVEVGVNGRGPYRFVVDSGADTSVIGERVARTLKLPPGTPVTLHGMTESARVERVLVDSLQLGKSEVADLQLPVLKEGHLGGDGMIGIDALTEQRLMMDFEKRVIKVEDAKRPPPSAPDEIVVVARLKRGQLILTQVTANRKKIDAVIDTGSMITIGNAKLRDMILRRRPDKGYTVEVTGVTGVTAKLQMATIGELRLGSIVLRDVPIAFADVPPFGVFGLADQPSLLLGTDILEAFRRVSLDFRARKVRFQLKRCQSTGVMLNTSYTYARTRMSSDRAEACKR